MEVIGIICEYNPFHNGHLYHIQKIKELYPDSLIILCLNGYFMQRGDISILTKEDKVKLSLRYGIDLVIELPVFYGTQSADYFAHGAITLLSSLNITHLVFGSETSDLELLKSIASEQLQSDFVLEKEESLSYPTNLLRSLKHFDVIAPNDLLAISYIKEIMKLKKPIIPIAIQRTSSYHDTTSNDAIISASNIRDKYQKGIDVTPFVPFEDPSLFNHIDEQKFFEFLKFRIITSKHLDEYLDVVEGLDYKLKKEVLLSTTYEEFLHRIKSKRYTYNRMKRMCIHIFLGITKEPMELSYVKILGFNTKGKEYLNSAKKNFTLPTIVNKSSKQYQMEITSSLLYDLLTLQNTYTFEKKNQPIYRKEAMNKESSQK